MADEEIKDAENAGTDKKDEFLPGDDAPNYRAGDGTFVPHEDAPEFPKANGQPPAEGGEHPEFRFSDGVTTLEGGAATKQPLPENTTDTPAYAEVAQDWQTTKAEAAENDDFNHVEDIPVQDERADGIDRAVTDEHPDVVEVEADKDNIGDALSNNAVLPGPDAAADKAEVEAENAENDQALIDEQLETGGKAEPAIEVEGVDQEARDEADAVDVASDSTVSDEEKAEVAENIAEAREDGFDEEAKAKDDAAQVDGALQAGKKGKGKKK